MKKLLLILISFFILTGLVNNESPETEITCLAQNIYFESRDQSTIGQIAVAEVHLANGNYLGATILYGEGLGR